FGVYMATDGAKVERSKKLIFRELDKLVQKPMSRQKLSQAQSQLKGALMLGLESLSNRMMRLGRMVLYDQPFRTLDEIIGSIEAVNETDLQDLAGDLFDPEQFSSAVLMPG
ncbi:MAG: insulinase family protein, partial [Bacteroidota bacterium]